MRWLENEMKQHSSKQPQFFLANSKIHNVCIQNIIMHSLGTNPNGVGKSFHYPITRFRKRQLFVLLGLGGYVFG
jgi:hypothetical protein